MAMHFWSIPARAGEGSQDERTPPCLDAYAIGVLCWLLLSAVYIAAKYTAAEMPPWTLCFWRVAIAGMILLPTTRSDWRSIEVLGASKAGIFLYFQTILIAVLAHIFLGEHLYLYHLVGAGFIIAGVLLVVSRKPQLLRSAPVCSPRLS